MAAVMRLEVLPARHGDCLLLECLREGERPWRMLVDGGPSSTWRVLEARLRSLPDPAIDVAVCSHIDADHIGGFIPFLLSDLAQHVGDVWFNGRRHLPEQDAVLRSVRQGERVSSILDEADLPWNAAFDGDAVTGGDHGRFREVTVPGGPRITVLSPSLLRLSELARGWDAVLDRVDRAAAARPGRDTPPPPIGDLDALARTETRADSSVANGASIAVLVEHGGASVLLAADAFAGVVGASLWQLAQSRGSDVVDVDVFKLPHHGSQANVTRELLEIAPARHYVFSTNGEQFRHPDDVAVARTIAFGRPGAQLWFNDANARTRRWADHAPRCHFPTGSSGGVTLELTGP